MPFTGKFLLRGRLDVGALVRLGAVLSHPLPERPNYLHGAGPYTLMLAPSRWMIFGGAALLAGLRDAVAGTGLAVSDMSDGHVQIDLEGPLAPELLAAGTAVDLNPSAFPVGKAAQTQLARACALICRFDESVWSLFVDASVADYTWEWLSTNGARITTLADHQLRERRA